MKKILILFLFISRFELVVSAQQSEQWFTDLIKNDFTTTGKTKEFFRKELHYHCSELGKNKEVLQLTLLKIATRKSDLALVDENLKNMNNASASCCMISTISSVMTLIESKDLLLKKVNKVMRPAALIIALFSAVVSFSSSCFIKPLYKNRLKCARKVKRALKRHQEAVAN